MKSATIKQIKQELSNNSSEELLEICLRLSKFKKENKELLTYLLFEASDENTFIENAKAEIEQQFAEMNTKSYYYMKKSIRKILRGAKTNIRYSKKKETEVELLLFFCTKLKNIEPSINQNTVLYNIYNRQIDAIKKAISHLHEDLKYDYGMELSLLRKV